MTDTTLSRDRQERNRRSIIERARRPHFSGVLEPADAIGTAHNPSCGDRVTVTLRLTDSLERLAQVRCSTRGCVLCTASADLMAEVISNQTTERVLTLGHGFVALLKDELPPDQDDQALTPLHVLAGLPARARCALLPWQALSKALNLGVQTSAGVPAHRL